MRVIFEDERWFIVNSFLSSSVILIGIFDPVINGIADILIRESRYFSFLFQMKYIIMGMY